MRHLQGRLDAQLLDDLGRLGDDVLHGHAAHELGELAGGSRQRRHGALAAVHAAADVAQREGQRRRGAGTTVIASASPQAYVQPLGGVDELLQYAHTARLKLLAQEERRLSEAEIQRIGGDIDRTWLVVDGLRIADALPLALSRIYVPQPSLAAGQSVHALLDERFGAAAGRIDQEITAEILSPNDAKVLKAEPGSAALRTLRRYHDDDALILASDSLHPGGRFVYAMRYRREG